MGRPALPCAFILSLAACSDGTPAPRARPTREPSSATPRRPESDAGRAEAPDPWKRALAHFYGKLAASDRGIVRVLHFGDSHTAPDIITGVVRDRLQARWGDAGHGYFVPGWPGYRHRGVRSGGTAGWSVERVFHAPSLRPGDRLYGVGGASVRTSFPATLWMETTASRFEVHFLRHPAGGTLELRLDGSPWRRIRTAGTDTVPGFEVLEAEDGRHRLTIRSRGDGEVHVLGVSAERPGPGIVWSSLGVNGAQIVTPLEWDSRVRSAQIERLRPDLVVAMYGTNDVAEPGYTSSAFARNVVRFFEAMRGAAPEASCLLLAPPDSCAFAEDGSLAANPDVTGLVAAGRRAAEEAGCAFWDTQAAMGGSGGFLEWAGRTPPLARQDGIHLTAAGYERLGNLLAQEVTLLGPNGPRSP